MKLNPLKDERLAKLAKGYVDSSNEDHEHPLKNLTFEDLEIVDPEKLLKNTEPVERSKFVQNYRIQTGIDDLNSNLVSMKSQMESNARIQRILTATIVFASLLQIILRII